jgi:hypothetical protein
MKIRERTGGGQFAKIKLQLRPGGGERPQETSEQNQETHRLMLANRHSQAKQIWRPDIRIFLTAPRQPSFVARLAAAR